MPQFNDEPSYGDFLGKNFANSIVSAIFGLPFILYAFFNWLSEAVLSYTQNSYCKAIAIVIVVVLYLFYIFIASLSRYLGECDAYNKCRNLLNNAEKERADLVKECNNRLSSRDNEWSVVLSREKQQAFAEANRVHTENVIKSQKLEKREGELDIRENAFYNAVLEKTQSYPWLASQVADVYFVVDQQISKELLRKKRPATVASKEVAEIAKEKRRLQQMCKQYEYQLNFYETIFPWLEEFKEVDPIEAWESEQSATGKTEYELLRNWLSPEEYQKLPDTEKYQLALDRYKKKRKTNWQVGIDFERFVGYKLEESGYVVKYLGALYGLEDMGRDLLAIKGNRNIVVQCKRWAKEKTIHEKHIFQLYGSMVLLRMQNPDKNYEGRFVTTTVLSDTARECADFLKITCSEEYQFDLNYPVIKCNISSDGEKIYHLPFDQQYDRIIIDFNKGERYVSTVKEADALGFRRAKKWVSIG